MTDTGTDDGHGYGHGNKRCSSYLSPGDISYSALSPWNVLNHVHRQSSKCATQQLHNNMTFSWTKSANVTHTSIQRQLTFPIQFETVP